MRQLVSKGKIENNKLLIAGKNELNEFLRKNNGRTVFMTIQAFDKGSTEAQIGLYYAKIIPDVQQGFYEQGQFYTEKDIDELLRKECPFVNDKVENLDKEDMSKFIDWAKFYLAENLQIFVPDWRTL